MNSLHSSLRGSYSGRGLGVVGHAFLSAAYVFICSKRATRPVFLDSKMLEYFLFLSVRTMYVVRGAGWLSRNDLKLLVVVTSFVEPKQNICAVILYFQTIFRAQADYGEDCMCAFVVFPRNG